MDKRLDIRKTYKLHIGGKFVRSESGRVMQAKAADGGSLDHYALASRKDFRDAVAAARAAFEGWSKQTAYLRGQILYRAAEMLEKRAGELAEEIRRATGARARAASSEAAAAVDRLVYYAGWTDKLQQVFGSVNPVASPHFNFTVPEPTGVVVGLAPDAPALLPLVTLLASIVLTGNTTVLVASEKYPLAALTFAEIVATSDLPGGVVNLLAGRRADLASHIASHMDVNAIVDGTGDQRLAALLRGGTGFNVKRYFGRALKPDEWFTDAAETPYWAIDTTEYKTAWHPIGL